MRVTNIHQVMGRSTRKNTAFHLLLQGNVAAQYSQCENPMYPLVNVYITMERSTIFNGKIHYKYYKWQFSIAFCMFTRG